MAAAAFTVAAHLGLLAAVMLARPDVPRLADEPPMVIELIQLPPPRPPEPPKPVALDQPEPAKPPPPKRVRARPARMPPPPQVQTIAAGKATKTDGVDELSDAEVASASTVGSGSGAGGAGCDMSRRLQLALRKDRRVQAAVAEVERGRAIRIWNGDWVRHGEQDGAGLAAVREAILWEVGFAPEACRDQRMRGLIVLSLNDAPGGPRIAVGAGDWRWSEMLGRGARR